MVEIDDLADVVMQAIETATAPLIARIASLEKRALVHGRDGRDAPPVDLDALALKAAAIVPVPAVASEWPVFRAHCAREMAEIDRAVKAAIASIPPPIPGRDGKDADPVDLDALAAKAAAKIPPPRDGRDGTDADQDLIKQIIAKLEAVKVMADLNSESVSTLSQRIDERMTKAIEALPVPQNGKDGKDVDAAMLEVIVAAHVERAISAFPRPADGKSLSPMDVEPLIQAEVAKAARAGQDGRDGVSVAWAMVDHAGMLHLTLSDGKAIQCGPVRGADVDFTAVTKAIADEVAKIPIPKDGRDGTSVDRAEVEAMVTKAVEALPPAKNGRDGSDGFGFDDIDVFMDEEKGAIVRFKQDDRVKDFPMPWLVDRGVYVAGKRYHKGASVTAQGSIWTAQVETRARPGDGSKDWRLAVKRGRDGKDVVREPSDG